jgi:hypothetical protein
MELIRSRIRRSKLGEIAYAGINALLPIALLLMIHGFDSPYPALLLVLLSKWRIFALRPRFWWINLKANAVDLLVGISVVGLLYISMTSLLLQLIVAFGYGVWLLYLKHRSDASAIRLQAGIAQFLALTVLFSLSTVVIEPLVIAGCWVIGYSVARHLTSVYDEGYIELLSCLWGLFVAQIGWLLFHWTIAYDIGLPVKIPQIALILLVISFSVTRLYVAAKDGRLGTSLIRLTTIYSVVLLAIILLFSRWDVTI